MPAPDRLTDALRKVIADAKLAWERTLDGPSEGYGDFEAGFLAALPREDEGLREDLRVFLRTALKILADSEADGIVRNVVGTPWWEGAHSALAASPVASREVEGPKDGPVGSTYEVFAEVRHHSRHCEDWEQRISQCWKLADTGDAEQMVADALREWADEIAPRESE